MPRILGVDIPKNKKIGFSLRYIYGIGPYRAEEILKNTGINPNKKAGELSDEEVSRIASFIQSHYKVEGELRREVSQSIRRLIDIGCYRGIRHKKGLPVRGQRTRTNARTKRGPRKTVAGRGRRRGVAKK